MSALRGPLVFVTGLALAAMWLWAAAGKLLDAEPAYELVASLIDAKPVAHLSLALIVGLEVALGVGIVLRVVRGLFSSFVLLLAFTVFLAAVDARGGELLPCGCFGTTDATVAESITRNLWMLVGVAVVIGLDLVGRILLRPQEVEA